MIKSVYVRSRIKKLILYSFLSVLVIGIVLPSFIPSSEYNIVLRSKEDSSQEMSLGFNFEHDENPSIPLTLGVLAEDEPEAYFPNFLFYSVETANALIDHLYDNTSGGFYISADEIWQNTSINYDKRTYDNAQAILAFLKLADAVINQTERVYALDIAEKTGNAIITELYDTEFDGFFISKSNRMKKPGVQAKAIQALLSLYELTGNLTYRNKAISAYDFLNNFAWNSENGHYIYLLSHSGTIPTSNPNVGDPYEPQSKRTDHNALMGQALLDLYRIESDDKYLTQACQIYDFFNTTSRNISTGLFYTGLNGDNELVENDSADIFINSLVLEFLAQLYNVTEDSKYYDDFFRLLNAVLFEFWDENYGGFFATYSYFDQEERDEKKYTERLFYAIRALDEAYKLTDESLYYNLVLDVIEILNNKLYDQNHKGYFQLVNNDGTSGDPSWRNKYSVTQSLAIFALANLWLYSKPGVLNALWIPSNPRPQDSVTVLVAAFDVDGISNVLFNYSINNGPYLPPIEMVPHSKVGNMFNTTLNSHPDGTKIRFEIIVNDTLGKETVRSFYEIIWLVDEWGPHVEAIGINPGINVPVNTRVSIMVSAHDVPEQGDVTNVRIYYQQEKMESWNSKKLDEVDAHLWEVVFPDGLGAPGGYKYYFEALDDRQNVGYSESYYLVIQGQLESLPMLFVVGGLIFVLFFIPGGLFTYVEYKRRTARKTLKNIRKVREANHRGKRRRSRRNN
ncbi:MAG: AGE family epimerase/isomerase [Candidatus Hodarchaeota archaeon]